LQIEKSNTALAKENLDISMERLRLGQTTSLELHQAQESYVDSHTRLTNFEYILKVAETKLKQLLSAL
jgi:outer membrane protein TolC